MAGTENERAGDGLSMADVVDILVRRWKLWVAAPIVLGALAVGVSLLLTTRYRSSASFIPEIPEASAEGLAGLLGEQAAALGIASLAGPGPGSAFYVDLVRSRAIREAVVEARYRNREGEEVGTLVDFFDYADVEPPARAVEKTVRALADRTRVSRDLASDIVTVAVTTRDPSVSRQIADRYVEAIRAFNQSQRALQTRERVEFLEAQLRSARNELGVVEDSLQTFLERNRAYENSPALVFRKSRLDRRVAGATTMVQNLEQQYRQARLDLLGRIPAISIVDPPRVPQEKVSPRRTMIVLTVTALGLVLGLFGALLVEAWEGLRGRLSPEARRRLETVRARARQWTRGRGR